MPPSTTKLNEWQDLIRTTVARYHSRVVGVEVWNEPQPLLSLAEDSGRPHSASPHRHDRVPVAVDARRYDPIDIEDVRPV